MSLFWEEIYRDQYSRTYRAEVIGGWIIRHREWSDDAGETMSMVFINDPEHDWDV